MDIPVTIGDLISEFLSKRLQGHSIAYREYGFPIAPNKLWEYKAPELIINGIVVGWMIDNETKFIPYSSPNARDEYKTVSIAHPDFFEILYAMVVYELGYDPVKMSQFARPWANQSERMSERSLKYYYPIEDESSHNSIS